MSGLALTTFSPSSSSTTRRTPCVEGCCGPMLRTMDSACPATVETVVGISDNLPADNLCAADSLLSLRAAGCGSGQDAHRSVYRRGQTLRVRARSPSAIPGLRNRARAAARSVAFLDADAGGVRAKAGDSSA